MSDVLAFGLDKMYEVVYETSKGGINTVQGTFVGVKDGKLYYDVDYIGTGGKEFTDRMHIDLGRSRIITTRFIEKGQLSDDD
jgi:hypothetical protein